MPNFWDTLVAYGESAATKVITPIGTGISTGFSNLVQTGANKVASVSATIAQTTDPNKPTASQPAAPPTTTSTPAQIKATAAAKTQASFGIVAVVAVIVLILYLKGRK